MSIVCLASERAVCTEGRGRREPPLRARAGRLTQDSHPREAHALSLLPLLGLTARAVLTTYAETTEEKVGKSMQIHSHSSEDHSEQQTPPLWVSKSSSHVKSAM